MDVKTALRFALILMFISCINEKDRSINSEIVNEKSSLSTEGQNHSLDKERIVNDLQGIWKEKEYPFREVHFKDTLVKLMEEGIEKEPIFQKFDISSNCPFDVNNIQTISPKDQILVINEAGICEKLEISNNALILRGYNTNTKSDYEIVYIKVN